MVLSAFAVVAATRLALTLLPSRVIIRTVARISNAGDGAPLASIRPRPKQLDPRRIVWAVERAAVRIPGASCLTQALAAHVLLRKHAHPSRLCLGVARTAGKKLRAHAWLESQGRIIIGADGVAALTRLPALPRNPRFAASQDRA